MMIKPRRLRQAQHVNGIGEDKGFQNLKDGGTGRTFMGRLKYRWEEKMMILAQDYLAEINVDLKNWNDLAH